MTAQERFAGTPEAQQFAAFVQTPAFHLAAEAAMLAFLDRQSRGAGPAQAWDEHSRLVGARDFLEVLRTVHMPAQAKKPTAFPTLRPPS